MQNDELLCKKNSLGKNIAKCKIFHLKWWLWLVSNSSSNKFFFLASPESYVRKKLQNVPLSSGNLQNVPFVFFPKICTCCYVSDQLIWEMIIRTKIKDGAKMQDENAAAAYKNIAFTMNYNDRICLFKLIRNVPLTVIIFDSTLTVCHVCSILHPLSKQYTVRVPSKISTGNGTFPIKLEMPNGI